MKNTRKLSVMIASMIVAAQIGATTSIAAPSAEAATSMQEMIAAGDFDALYAFLVANPELLQERSALASALREFVSAYSSGSFAFTPMTLMRMQTALGAVTGINVAVNIPFGVPY